jgi:hypothetical protein
MKHITQTIFLLFFSLSLFAQQDTASTLFSSMEEVVVTATKTETKIAAGDRRYDLRENPSKTAKATEQELENIQKHLRRQKSKADKKLEEKADFVDDDEVPKENESDDKYNFTQAEKNTIIQKQNTYQREIFEHQSVATNIKNAINEIHKSGKQDSSAKIPSELKKKVEQMTGIKIHGGKGFKSVYKDLEKNLNIEEREISALDKKIKEYPAKVNKSKIAKLKRSQFTSPKIASPERSKTEEALLQKSNEKPRSLILGDLDDDEKPGGGAIKGKRDY